MTVDHVERNVMRKVYLNYLIRFVVLLSLLGTRAEERERDWTRSISPTIKLAIA